MFKTTRKSSGDDVVLYEICDKDYQINLRILNVDKLTTIIKYPILKSHKGFISSPKEKISRYTTGIEELDELIDKWQIKGDYEEKKKEIVNQVKVITGNVTLRMPCTSSLTILISL